MTHGKDNKKNGKAVPKWKKDGKVLMKRYGNKDIYIFLLQEKGTHEERLYQIQEVAAGKGKNVARKEVDSQEIPIVNKREGLTVIEVKRRRG